jgi:hypothetical protein
MCAYSYFVSCYAFHYLSPVTCRAWCCVGVDKASGIGYVWCMANNTHSVIGWSASPCKETELERRVAQLDSAADLALDELRAALTAVQSGDASKAIQQIEEAMRTLNRR